MLKFLFQWFDGHPASYWLILAGPTLLYLAWTIWPARTAHPPGPRPMRGFWGALLLFAFLLAWRWPWLLNAFPYSPDESQHVAGILTLAKDPVFFRSVDGSTAGPLNFYFPLPLGVLLGKIDYFTVRLAGLMLVWGALWCCYLAMARLTGPLVARLGLLPAALFFATTTDWEFLHYSTEHAPVFLFSLCLWLLVRASSAASPGRWLIAAGLAAGLFPWAKLQIGPMSAGLVLAGLWQIAATTAPWRDRLRQGALLGGSTLIPTALALITLHWFGLVETAYLRYVQQNLHYVEEGRRELDTLRELMRLAWASGWFPAFAAGPLLAVLLAGLAALAHRQRLSRAYVGGAALTAIAVLCVKMPGRTFQHYLLLLVFPLLLWGTAAAHELWRRFTGPRSRLGLGVGLLAAGLLPLTLLRFSHPVPPMFGLFADHWRNPRSEVNDLIYRLARPNDRVALWGYAPEVYAATGLAQGTRDSYSYWSISPGEQRDRYRAEYLEDIRRNRPVFFIDAVGPGSIYYPDRQTHGHQCFPELANYISRQYRLVASRHNFRIYLRHEAIARRSGSQKFQAALRDAATPSLQNMKNSRLSVDGITTEPLSVAGGRWERMRGSRIMLLPPPGTVTCDLTGTERELQLDYGFHPRAIAARASDGANLYIEITSPDHPAQPVFQRFLDPGVNRTPRMDYTLTIPLPPFPPGAQLVIRTDQGPAASAAWDWVYVSRLQLLRTAEYQPAQFPGFSHAPESASASTAYYIGEANQRRLMQHAPARNVFRLNGRERNLRFAFGFNEGAYSGNGRTDGAIFRVEHQREHGQPTTLFERKLEPTTNPRDRGTQQCAVELPDIAEDDRLVVSIDQAGNPSWDWTYVTDLTLD